MEGGGVLVVGGWWGGWGGVGCDGVVAGLGPHPQEYGGRGCKRG